jgi:hypothetical protein
MNIAQIEEAVHRRVPFSLKVADGDEYRLPHSDYIFLPPAFIPGFSFTDGGRFLI